MKISSLKAQHGQQTLLTAKVREMQQAAAARRKAQRAALLGAMYDMELEKEGAHIRLEDVLRFHFLPVSAVEIEENGGSDVLLEKVVKDRNQLITLLHRCVDMAVDGKGNVTKDLQRELALNLGDFAKGLKYLPSQDKQDKKVMAAALTIEDAASEIVKLLHTAKQSFVTSLASREAKRNGINGQNSR